MGWELKLLPAEEESLILLLSDESDFDISAKDKEDFSRVFFNQALKNNNNTSIAQL
jgi:hypothetical protein